MVIPNSDNVFFFSQAVFESKTAATDRFEPLSTHQFPFFDEFSLIFSVVICLTSLDKSPKISSNPIHLSNMAKLAQVVTCRLESHPLLRGTLNPSTMIQVESTVEQPVAIWVFSKKYLFSIFLRRCSGFGPLRAGLTLVIGYVQTFRHMGTHV